MSRWEYNGTLKRALVDLQFVHFSPFARDNLGGDFSIDQQWNYDANQKLQRMIHGFGVYHMSGGGGTVVW